MCYIIKMAHLLLQNGHEHEPHWITTIWESIGLENKILSRKKKNVFPNISTDPESKESALITPTTIIATIGTIRILQHKGKAKEHNFNRKKCRKEYGHQKIQWHTDFRHTLGNSITTGCFLLRHSVSGAFCCYLLLVEMGHPQMWPLTITLITCSLKFNFKLHAVEQNLLNI